MSAPVIRSTIAFRIDSQKMPEQNNSVQKKLSLDWLLRGVLTKVGDTFDRLTGRRWTPSSSLATSELIEKLKHLLDAEARDLAGKGKFVPHNIKLKMQWDKFSTDAEKALKKLENELTIAAIDHINDNRYHTYAPLKIEIKPDYFTEGVKLLASFDKFVEEDREAAISVTVPQINNVGNYIPEPPPEEKPVAEAEIFYAVFSLQGKARRVELRFKEKERRSVGRTKENDLSLDDPSVSKIHAALVMNSESQLMVADTGSTNGTFINDERIAYGRAFVIKAADRVKFGTIEVVFEHAPRARETPAPTALPDAAPSASQKEIQTVAFNSNEHVPVGRTAGPPLVDEKSSGDPAPAAREPGEAESEDETNRGRTGTRDRVVFDFPKEN
jgi:pSer/pThr/pTyr-binding forkhead associated (FHA) protein